MTDSSSSRFAFLDSLRFVAAALVVFQHLGERNAASGAIHALIGLGPGVAGVALFFLISGYVIPFSIRDGFRPTAFLIRRLARIYPLYLVTLAALLVAGTSGLLADWDWLGSASWRIWLANLALVQDFTMTRPILGVSWTLIIEMIWYGLFAIVWQHSGSDAGRWLGWLVPVGLATLGLISWLIDTRIPLGRPTMIYAAVLGFQAFRAHRGEISTRALIQHVAVFLVVTSFTNIVAFGYFHHPRISLMQALGPWTVAPLLFFGFVRFPPMRTAPLLTQGLLPMLGRASYSIYLLHPVAIAIASTYLPAAMRVPASLALTAMLAALGYRLVELPGIAMGRAMVARLSPRRAQ